jgi:hypothetical protein
MNLSSLIHRDRSDVNAEDLLSEHVSETHYGGWHTILRLELPQ